jgi:diguanylate cyclase
MPVTAFLTPHHDVGLVAASILIATLASFVTLDLARQVRTPTGRLDPIRWLAGSLILGTGIWSMHFVGMLGFSLPIRLGFGGLLTMLSWVAAVGASAFALSVASRVGDGFGAVAAGAAVLGTGICAMHYLGMAALDMAPAIVWDVPVVALSILIAVAGSAASILISQQLLGMRGVRRLRRQLLAALLMGAAISGMHYTGMAAALFPADSICLSANALHGSALSASVVVAASMLLLGTLLTTFLEARLKGVARQLKKSLEDSNARLELANFHLAKRALCDSLTGLPNRLLFEDRLRQALLRLEEADSFPEGIRIAVLFVDLDGFKPVNDSFGHEAGDQVLRTAAARLLEQVREGDTVARIGGDEFLVLLDGLDEESAGTRVADRIRRALAEPFTMGEKKVRISCSIGIATHPGEGAADRLIANADAAMYKAKRAGGDGFAVFEPGMAVNASDQLELLSDLRLALEREQFELFYQPKVDSHTGKIRGVEALARWNHPARGRVGPDDFMGVAERAGLIVSIGGWVLNEACRQIATWNAQGFVVRVSVNLSALQLRESALCNDVRSALQRHGVPGAQLVCEVTESVALLQLDATRQNLDGLAKIGVHLSIDDFGTGHSNLSQLRRLPARELKIDRSFVSELESQQDARFVVAAVINLAHALRMTVVAEGVETAAQRDILRGLQCDELQGFYFARPMKAADILAWSADHEPITTPLAAEAVG